MKSRKLTKRNEGFVMVMTLCFAVLLILAIIPLITWAVNEYMWTSRSFAALQALNLADAGAELGIWEIVYNGEQFTSWSGTNPKTMSISSFTDNNGKVTGDIAISADQTSPQHYQITSTGTAPNSTKPIGSKTIKVSVFPKPLFNNAVFGADSVTLSGIALVDSYDSRVGPYSSLTAKANGDVGTNGVLSMVGTTSVKGDALIVPGGSATGVESRITGEVYYASEPLELDLIGLPDYFASVPTSPDLDLNHDITPLASGNYHFEEIKMSSSAVLTVSNDTNIYVSNSMTLTGSAQITTGSNVKFYINGTANIAGQGILNATGRPNNLQIYGLGSSTSISYSGGSNFYGTIYAPDSDVSVSGGASLFGAIVGESVSISGTGTLHYDESLSDNGPSQGFSIIYWQEN